MNPYAVSAAPIQYDISSQIAANQAAAAAAAAYAAGYAQQAAQYGMVSYPVTDPNYAAAGFAGASYQAAAPSYTGLDAAVYSAASAMLVERGLTSTTPAPTGTITGYSNTLSKNQNQNTALARLESMNPIPSTSSASIGHGALRGSSRGGRGGRGGGPAASRYPKKNDKPRDPANQASYYCETCKVSCAGAVSYKTHMVGQKHLKREEMAKKLSSIAPAVMVTHDGRTAPSKKCDLCGIIMAGDHSYEAHLKGKSHQRTLKLHMKMGKPIPENEPTITQRTIASAGSQLKSAKPTIGSSICTKVVTGGKTVLITPKMNFVGGTVLTTTKTGLAEVPVPGTPAEGAQDTSSNGESNGNELPSGPFVSDPTQPPLRKQPTPYHPGKNQPGVNTSFNEPIGREYVQKTEKEGRVAYYKCTLCNCEFSDESGMNSHIRGRRHRTSYKQKVDPTIEVDLPESAKKAQRRVTNSTRGGLPPSGPRGPPSGIKRSAPPRGAASKRPNRGPVPPPLRWGPLGPPPLRHPSHPYLPPREPYYEPGRYDGYGAPPPHGPPQYQGPPYGESQPYYGEQNQPYGGHPNYGLPVGQEPQFDNRPPNFGPPPGQENALNYGPPQGPLQEQHFSAENEQQARLPMLPFDQDENFDNAEPITQRPLSQKATTRLDQKYLLIRHRSIVPEATSLDGLEFTVGEVEKALKNVSEKFMLADANAASGWCNEGLIEIAPDAPPSVRSGMQRFMKGSYRFGRLTKNLLTKNDLYGEILLICNAHPTVGQLNTVGAAVRKEMEAGAPASIQYSVVTEPSDCRIVVKLVEPPTEANPSPVSYPIYVYLAFGNLRDQLSKMTPQIDGGGMSRPSVIQPVSQKTTEVAGSSASPEEAKPPTTFFQALQQQQQQQANGYGALPNPFEPAGQTTTLQPGSELDIKRSLAVLAQSRRTRWFQEFITFFPQCRMVMRILNHIFEHCDDLRELAGWPVEFLTITVLRLQAAYHGMTPFDIPLAEAFWMILSTISSGVFLPGCTNGFKDPCERGNVDILGEMSAADRVRLTKAVSDLLIFWLSGNFASVLDVEVLPEDPQIGLEGDPVDIQQTSHIFSQQPISQSMFSQETLQPDANNSVSEANAPRATSDVMHIPPGAESGDSGNAAFTITIPAHAEPTNYVPEVKMELDIPLPPHAAESANDGVKFMLRGDLVPPS